jgi:hypothetical protein
VAKETLFEGAAEKFGNLRRGTVEQIRQNRGEFWLDQDAINVEGDNLDRGLVRHAA